MKCVHTRASCMRSGFVLLAFSYKQHVGITRNSASATHEVLNDTMPLNMEKETNFCALVNANNIS